MFTSFFTGIVALLAAMLGVQQTQLATVPAPITPAAHVRSAQVVAIASTVAQTATPTTTQLSDTSSAGTGTQSIPSTPSTAGASDNASNSSPEYKITAPLSRLSDPLAGYATQADLASSIASLDATFQSEIAAVAIAPIFSGASAPISVQEFAPSQAIDQLSGTTLSNITVHGVSGLAPSDIPALAYLPITGGTISGLSNFANASTSLFSSYGPAYFGATATSSFNSAGALTLASALGVGSGGTGTTSLPATIDSLTGASGALTGAIVRLQSGLYGLAPSICSLFSDATTCAKLLGYADPRQFGAYCGSDFNVNNNTEDDAPGINAALQTGVPVMIPYPGCKIASQVKFTGNGQTLFSFGGSGPYSAQQAPTEPYIFVTNDVATASPNNCAIDTQGYDGVTLRDITMLANYSKEGTVAICNSVGIRGGLSAAFLNIDGVTISAFGDEIGGATTNTFTPTGTLQNNVFQIRGQNLNVSNSGAGMYGNFSDVHLSDTFFSSNDGPCFSTIPGYAGAIEMDNMRCEYSGTTYGGSTLQEDGTGIYLDGSNAVHLSNVICDHDYGACITIGDGSGAGSHVTLDNITSYDSDKGGSAVANQCHYVINGASYVSATNIESINRDYSAPYALCTLGHPDYVTWHAVTGVAGGAAGYATSYLNMQNPIPYFDFSALGLPSFVVGDNTGIDTTTPAYPLDVAGFINTDQYSGYKQAGTTILYGTSTLTSVLVGPYAGNSTFTGTNNIGIGSSTLAALTTGSNNVAMSNSALLSLTTGSVNIAIGDFALAYATSTSDNVAIGHKALLMSSAASANNSGSFNTAVGFASLESDTAGSNNTAIGASALAKDTTGASNVAIGVNALYGNWSPTSTIAIGLSAACGTGCGGSASYGNQGGVYLGYQSGYKAATGSDFNTFLGYQSGYLNTSGTDNIFIGPQPNTSGADYITTGGNNIGIGFNVLFPVATANNQLNIGNFIFGTGLTATSSATILPSSLTGNLGIGTSTPYSRLEVWGPDSAATTSAFAVVNSASTTVFAAYDNGNATYSGSIFQSSDQRLKTSVQSLDASSSLSEIESLNPVSYLRLDQPDTGENLGFIAQQVQRIFPQLVSTSTPTALTPDGTLTLNYEGLISPIVSAIQDIASISGDFESNLIAWLGNAQNGIQDLFAHNIYATNELCIDNSAGAPVCITGDQLAAVLSAGGTPNGPEAVTSTDTSAATSTPPVIEVNGDNPATVDVGTTYNDLGATITGPQSDLNLGVEAIVDGGATTTPAQIQIDTTQPGTHIIEYVAIDQNGIEGSVKRTVIVVSAPAQLVSDADASSTDATSTDASDATSTDATSTPSTQ